LEQKEGTVVRAAITSDEWLVGCPQISGQGKDLWRLKISAQAPEETFQNILVINKAGDKLFSPLS
jgi:hypothetical protein